MIRFENNPVAANAPAHVVRITQQLDSDLDYRTFRLGDFSVGALRVDVPDNVSYYQTRLDLTATRGVYLDVAAGIDMKTGQAFWLFTSLDPATGTTPQDPMLGFLPPNQNSPEGQAYVTYSVKPKSTARTGDGVDATARIIFDTNEPIDTPSIFNTLDAAPPASQANALPASGSDRLVVVSWAGQDDSGGSGMAVYDIYVSDNGGAFSLWLEDTTMTQATFKGTPGHAYAFYSVARDNAGNSEKTATAPDTQITIQAASVAGRYVFYNNSWFDGNDLAANALDDAAIATDKTALLPGQKASFANYTSYSRGLNGIMIDIVRLADAQSISASDFTFKVGTSSDLSTWTSAPAPVSVTVRSGAGINGSDRVEVIWADNAIQKVWLQVTIGANAHTGLSSPDVFYFGNAIAESGNSPTDAAVTVLDILAARGRMSANAVSITSRWDYDRDGLISTADVQVAQHYLTAGTAIFVLLQAPSMSLAIAGLAGVSVGLGVQSSDSGMVVDSSTALDTSAPSVTAAAASSTLKPVLGARTALKPAVSTGPSLVPAPLSISMTAGLFDRFGTLVANDHLLITRSLRTRLAKAALVVAGESTLASGTVKFAGLSVTSRAKYNPVVRYRATKANAASIHQAILAQSTAV